MGYEQGDERTRQSEEALKKAIEKQKSIKPDPNKLRIVDNG